MDEEQGTTLREAVLRELGRSIDPVQKAIRSEMMARPAPRDRMKVAEELHRQLIVHQPGHFTLPLIRALADTAAWELDEGRESERAAMRRRYQRLPAQEHKVLHLLLHNKLTFKRIAERLNISTVEVNRLYTSAVEKLRVDAPANAPAVNPK